MAVAEGFRRLGGVADHEAGVRVRQVKSEEVDLALHAADDADSFAKVDLGMSRRMLQRHKHLLSPLTPAGDVILHNREAAREAVLVPETLKDPLRRMLLFPRARLVVEENPVDHRDERIKLRLGRRLCAHVTRRRRELHHLGDRARVNSKPSRRRAMAQPLDLNRVANAPIKLHALHPPPSADPTQRDICCRTFAPALPENPAASVRDYCSAACTACPALRFALDSAASAGVRRGRPLGRPVASRLPRRCIRRASSFACSASISSASNA